MRRKVMAAAVLTLLSVGIAVGCGADAADEADDGEPGPLTSAECSQYPSCAAGQDCEGGVPCFIVDGCSQPICIAFDDVCEQRCGSSSCSQARSDPARVICAETSRDAAADARADGGSSVAVECEACNIQTQLSALADPSATDCGEVFIGGDPAQTRQCIADALAEGRAFRATHWQPGIDSAVTIAWFGTANGDVVQLRFDADVCGGGGGCASGYDDCGPRVTRWTCRDPGVGTDGAPELIVCTELVDQSVICQPSNAGE